MIISRATLQISFLGGDTDFLEYFTKESSAVLAMGIDKYTCVVTSTIPTISLITQCAFHISRGALSPLISKFLGQVLDSVVSMEVQSSGGLPVVLTTESTGRSHNHN